MSARLNSRSKSLHPVHRFKLAALAVALVAALALVMPYREARAQEAATGAGTIVAGDGRRYSAPRVPVSVARSAKPVSGTVAPLRPALEAPLGVKPVDALGPESVIGVDGRARVNDTTRYPYRAVVWLLLTFRGGSQYSCTGWFAGAHLVVTAGHCVYDHAMGWATSITVYPARNANQTPYGSETVTRARLRSTSGWVDAGSNKFDYGAIILQRGWKKSIGFFGFRAGDSTSLQNLGIDLYGYPGDKPEGTLWGMSGAILGLNTRKLFYDVDTAGGQSGSPVWHTYSADCDPCAVGVHGYGVGLSPFPGDNSGVRINQNVFNNLYQWRTER